MDPREERLAAEITETEGAVDSAITFITGVRAELAALTQGATDFESLKANIEAYSARLDSAQTRLAEAVAANPS